MFHYPQRTSKTGRVVPKDTANLGLHYSFQAQASTVNERPTPRQGSGDKKTPHDNDFFMMPPVSNQVITPSTRFRFSPAADGDISNNTTANIQSVHPASNASDIARQQQNWQTFHELNKVQRQILHPVTASMTDAFSLAANLKQSKEICSNKPPVQTTNSASQGHSNKQVTDVQLPGDRVIFTESSVSPGVPVVYRLPEDRHANPDRVNLDRRKLTVCPILEGEDNVRLLNFQHNLITKIENLSQLKRLIFLDFYDNQLECISGLSALKSLRVLMLGKNRIRKIEKLDALNKLDVLDLHGNKISQIDNLNHLTELRVLNLAGNDIVHVNNLGGMRALAELNLRRNKIVNVSEVNLPNLQRLFLSFNCIQSFDDISCLSQCYMLSELSLDGNPLALDVSYKHTVLKNISSLRQFDMKRISEEEKRVANVIAKKEVEKKREHGRITHLKEKKRIAINNAQRQWEKSYIGDPAIASDESDIMVKIETIFPKTSTSETLFSQDGGSNLTICYLAELEGETLFLYGPGSLEALDRNWGQQAVNTVTCVAFKFIDFNEIVPHVEKLQAKFPVVQKLVFTSTNITSLQQINALAGIKHLECLTIKDGNPVTSFTLWKPYTLFRLAHLSLRQLNDVEVTAEDIVNAEKLFGALSHATTSNLPPSRLLSLLGDTRKRQTVDSEKVKRTEGKHERSLSNEGLGRAGLKYQTREMLETKKQESKSREHFSENYVRSLFQTCIRNHQKTKRLETLWPRILAEMVRDHVRDMTNLDSYFGKSLNST